jgi:hypothetical protein
MEAMGFPAGFNKLVALLFKDASASVKVNGVLSESFKIERGMRQGCALVSTSSSSPRKSSIRWLRWKQQLGD